MKKSIYYLLSLAVMVFGATVFNGAALAGDGETLWKTYVDKKYGYSIEYPEIFNKNDAYVDSDGLSFFSQYTTDSTLGDGRYAFEVFGGKNTTKATAESKLKDWTSLEEDANGYVTGVEPLAGTVKSGADFYTLAYIDDSAGESNIGIRHIYGVIKDGMIVEYFLRCPKEDAERCAEITKRMDTSLKVK